MRDELERLAARFRRAEREAEEARGRQEAEARAQRATARAARAALVEELAAFGAAAGLLVRREGEGLVWERAQRSVTLRPGGDALDVAWQERLPRTGRLYQEARLGGRWVLAIGAPPSEERLPLVETGLVRLLVDGLGLPAPADAPDASAAPDAPAPGAPVPDAPVPTDGDASGRRL